MNNKKIVKRKYFSKKLNKYIEKEYTYDASKYKKSFKFKEKAVKSKPVTYVFKSGKYSKAYQKEWERIKTEEGIVKANAFKNIIDTLRKTERVKKITSLSVQAVQSKYRIETFLNNLGSSVEDFAIQVSAEVNEVIEESYVLIADYWKFGQSGKAQFTTPSGRVVDVDFEYPAGMVIKS